MNADVEHVGKGKRPEPAQAATVRQAGMRLIIACLQGRITLPARGVAMVDTAKLVLFAAEALALLGVVLLFQRIIRTAKRRSDPVEQDISRRKAFSSFSGWQNGERQESRAL